MLDCTNTPSVSNENGTYFIDKLFDSLSEEVRDSFAQNFMEAIISDPNVPEEKKLFLSILKARKNLTNTLHAFCERYAKIPDEAYTEDDKEKLRKCAALLTDFKKQFEEELR